MVIIRRLVDACLREISNQHRLVRRPVGFGWDLRRPRCRTLGFEIRVMGTLSLGRIRAMGDADATRWRQFAGISLMGVAVVHTPTTAMSEGKLSVFAIVFVLVLVGLTGVSFAQPGSADGVAGTLAGVLSVLASSGPPNH